MINSVPQSLTLLQRWSRFRRSPRLPFILFFSMIAAGALSQAYCYWWSVRIEQMVNRNQGRIERIWIYPYWMRKYLGFTFVQRFEPIQSVKIHFRNSSSEKITLNEGDLALLWGLPFLTELFVGDVDLKKNDARMIQKLSGLKTVHFGFGNDPETVLDGIERLPNLTKLVLVVSFSTPPSVYARVAAMPRLQTLDIHSRDVITEGWEPPGVKDKLLQCVYELRKSRTLRRLGIRLDFVGQIQAMTRPLDDGTPPFPELREISLAGQRRYGIEEFADLKSLPSLVHLDLSGCNFRDAHLKSLMSIPRLRTLYLEENLEITDKGAEVLASMPTLESINVKHTRITNEGLLRIATLPRLRCLRAHPIEAYDPQIIDKLKRQLPTGCELDTN